MNINKYKTKLCFFYEKYNKCNNEDKCNYAHGVSELRCLFDEKCVNEKCKRIHIKRERDICVFTSKEENMDMDDTNYSDYNEENDNINIFDNEQFPIIKEKINNNENNNENNNDDNVNVKKKEENKILYSSVIKKGTIHKYSEDDNMNNYDEEIKSPEINVAINVNCKERTKFNNDINNKIVNIDEDNKELESLNEIQKIFEDFSKKFKNNIDKKFVDEKTMYSVNIKLELNDIVSRINLFKNNYEDILKVLKIKYDF